MTNLLLTLHAVANCLITIAAVGLFWQGWKAHKRSKKVLSELVAKKFADSLRNAFPQGGIRFEDLGSTSLTDDEQKNLSEWREYLRKSKGEALLTYPEWLEKKKEVANG